MRPVKSIVFFNPEVRSARPEIQYLERIALTHHLPVACGVCSGILADTASAETKVHLLHGDDPESVILDHLTPISTTCAQRGSMAS